MNGKNIKKHLNGKLNNWVKSIDDESVKKIVKENAIITGGAIVSLLTGVEVNDYDVYFKTKEAVIAVARYYIDKWNETHKTTVSLRVNDETGKIDCFVRSKGLVEEEKQDPLPFGDPITVDEIETDENGEPISEENDTEEQKEIKYRPRYFTSNAISLSDKIQLVIRFYGDVEEIHKNFDFVHCACAWSSWDNELFMPAQALECIINKEMQYVGSKYPLCSIIRTRKYLERGYTINAGQYVKMCMQLNELDLHDIDVLEEQLTGVDTTYFKILIDKMRERQQRNEAIDNTYVMGLIDKLF